MNSEVIQPSSLGAILQARNWYTDHRENGQYEGGQLLLYDRIVEVLARRSDFARFLCLKLSYQGVRSKILELASGTGKVSELLKLCGDLYCTDISTQALGVCKRRTGAKSCGANFLKLPFADESFGTVVCVGGYRYVEKEHEVDFWREADRVLVPGGQVLIGQFNPFGSRIMGTDLRGNDSYKPSGFVLTAKEIFTPRVFGLIPSGCYTLFDFRKPVNH
jgi:ubiquinone/menaquinone biosynthesis C-methylase UbiE